ncbi:hypothetical protein AB0I53_27845, partial [Saccharopolyspora sp. NPDC050389]|uniref:hypothetical protein n=1 Tax=Saccharopolyspora sp. NPDC050389 TaxID=3155516 RepID=UPI0033EC4F5F
MVGFLRQVAGVVVGQPFIGALRLAVIASGPGWGGGGVFFFFFFLKQEKRKKKQKPKNKRRIRVNGEVLLLVVVG